jgi:coenzyme F420-0:L-glutamate ligase/coenzyme F420-1:gamma-L-glutamate ligase
MTVPQALEVVAVPWPEVAPGDDLVGLILATVKPVDGDVLVVTSKVLSKSEGTAHAVGREELIDRETVRVVARRGTLRIVETRHGLVMAAAGVDSSNTPTGTALALPRDPDATARTIREAVVARTGGANVAVVVTDTIGRPWRLGQTDQVIGCAGMLPLQDLHGQPDTHGNTLQVTAPAIADEIAAAADLVKGKTSGRPLAVVRGLASLVLPIGQHGPGLRGLVRPRADDLFALGARDAVVAAVRRDDPAALAAFAQLAADDPDPFDAVVTVPPVELSVIPDDGERRGWTVAVTVPHGASVQVLVNAGRIAEKVRAVAAAFRLTEVPPDSGDEPRDAGGTVVDRSGWATS